MCVWNLSFPEGVCGISLSLRVCVWYLSIPEGVCGISLSLRVCVYLYQLSACCLVPYKSFPKFGEEETSVEVPPPSHHVVVCWK